MKQRYVGSLLGLAVGDCVGVALEFERPGTFQPVEDMLGGGPFELQKGEYTDDTSMALCLAESLITCGGFDPYDQMKRYVKWYKEGYFSSLGYCFDIGETTRSALERFIYTGEPMSGSTLTWAAGNGSIMRLCPVPLYYRSDAEQAIRLAADSSRTTHGAEEAVDACRYFAGLIVGALNGIDKETLLSSLYTPVEGLWERDPLSPNIETVAKGSFKELHPPDIQGTGYVVKSLEAALWAFYHSTTFKDGLLLAVNLGDDADTTGAVYGQIAGAYYGMDNIPKEWVEAVKDSEKIHQLAEQLYEESIVKRS